MNAPRAKAPRPNPARQIRKYMPALVVLALIVAVAYLIPNRTQACGPFFTDAIFVFSKHPDFPLDKYAAGKFGVIKESWARSYLVVAYRSLAGDPLSDAEAKAVKSLWDDRLNHTGDSQSDSWVKDWNEARKAAGATAPATIEVYRNREKPREYESFLNCQQDAFVNATNLLNERVKLFGVNSRQVQSWLAAQDAVFANCREGRHMPKDAASELPDLPPLLRSDRAYQIAAANFYSTNFDEAKQQFEAIGRDQESPYHIIAPYMAARAMLRKGSFAEKEDEGRPFLADAEARLTAILKDNSLKASHHAAGRLFNLARLRAHPEEKLHELAHQIMKKDASEDFKQGLWDYTILLDKYLEVEDETAKRQQLPAGLGADDLTDWIMTFEGDLEAGESHAIEKWQKTKALPWLVAALANASGKQPILNDLLGAAGNVSHTSPAFPTVAFHSVRLLNEANRSAEARAMLDKILTAERQQLNASALNQFLGQRMMLAQSLNEFLQNAPRRPAGYSYNDDGRELPDEDSAQKPGEAPKSLFDLDAANTFNKAMPVAIMKDAAGSKTLPANLRRDVAQAAFVRAAMLDDRETAIQAAASLESELPQVKDFLAAYQKATTPDARRFAAAFLTLKFPGLRPFVSAGVGRTTAVDEVDSYRDNYWCTEPPTPQNDPPSADAQSKSKFVAPDFLKTSRPLAVRQYAALQALGTGPNYLCRVAIEWAQKNAADPRAPEALHLAVRSTRYGCTDKETGRWSKAAFDLLHSRYPNTTWAKNTKYWFN